MKSTLQILIGARAVITNPDSWCTNHRFDESGHRHCALGALDVVRGTTSDDDASIDALAAALTPKEIAEAEKYLRISLGFEDKYENGWLVAAHNNLNGHAATLSMFDRAIARQQAFEDAAQAPQEVKELADA